ncbi:hypothetical protein [Sphingobacterium kitahiroshimense]|uniref:Uncharacterized protein n=1 Tax=Sphingobacterium kitahiroshimense TaxID=470446 RepID=A0ABV0C1T1_9SPHI
MNKDNNRKINQVINLLEEMSWILDNSNIKFKEIPLILQDALNSEYSESSISNKYKSKNPNKDQLIGILPNFLQDTDLFKTNGDLVDFGKTVLNIEITRSDKRPRYELIGLLICEIRNLNDIELSKLVNALFEISSNEKNLINIKNKKKNDGNFSWNDAIFKLNNNEF